MKTKRKLLHFLCLIWMFVNGLGKGTVIYKKIASVVYKKGSIVGFKSTYWKGVGFRFFIAVKWDVGGYSHFSPKQFNRSVLIAIH